ncbi:hypothetical protein KC320_g150 [Hortaea werneckii]|nr:hypothetical protein KC320_g150 [Hortaea werneckii]
MQQIVQDLLLRFLQTHSLKIEIAVLVCVCDIAIAVSSGCARSHRRFPIRRALCRGAVRLCATTLAGTLNLRYWCRKRDVVRVLAVLWVVLLHEVVDQLPYTLCVLKDEALGFISGISSRGGSSRNAVAMLRSLGLTVS